VPNSNIEIDLMLVKMHSRRLGKLTSLPPEYEYKIMRNFARSLTAIIYTKAYVSANLI